MADDKNRILVIDDENSVLQMVEKLLTKHGYEVSCARDGLEGLRHIDRDRPDLVIADIIMPVLDGITLVKALKKQQATRSTPVIFLTAKSDPLSMIEGINVGAKFYVTKPFQTEDLLSKVSKVLQGSSHRIG
ncbi:MAG: response regulator [Myxococcales bacterium]|nr:response regulator [Myxococcales bacterium]